jgi:aminoglycoside phosphotransferase (APT) family kinase protein
VNERLLGSGRDAEIVDLGHDHVLRRTRVPRSLEAEAALMLHVREAGYPVPRVHEVRADGMVMERIDGPTMLDDVISHPWRLYRHARTLAELHRRLHTIPPPAGARPVFGAEAPDDSVVHGDLHPANILLSPVGPIVIDWSGGGRGAGAADVADAWLLLAAAEPPTTALLIRVAGGLLRERLLAAFLRHAGRAEAARYLPVAAARRTADENLSEREKAAMLALAGLAPAPPA